MGVNFIPTKHCYVHCLCKCVDAEKILLDAGDGVHASYSVVDLVAERLDVIGRCDVSYCHETYLVCFLPVTINGSSSVL